jgi:outer membrane beta-barrel protein
MMGKFQSKIFLLLIGTLMGASLPQAAQADEDDYDFNWLDPDKKIYVLQNRKYLKAGRPYVMVLGGVALAEPYRQGFSIDPKIGMYFTESLGIELFYSHRFYSTNSTYSALVDRSGVDPIVHEIKSVYGAVLQWSPWYAKINVFNTILHFDWYFNVGAGMIRDNVGPRTPEEKPADWRTNDQLGLVLGTGHVFHINRSLVFRLDFTSLFYNTFLYNDQAKKAWFSNFTFGAGIGLRF